MPHVYLNGATIMTTPTPRQLAIARAAGFAGIEARAERLLADPEEVAETADAVQNVDVWSLNGVRIGLDADGALRRDELDVDLAARIEVCDAIHARCLLVVPPRVSGLTETAALPGVRDGLQLARHAAAARGVRIAFEFLGFADCPIATPAAAAAAVDGIEGVDLVLDSCHWHASGSSRLDRFPVERLAMVHLNDAPQKPLREIEDGDRVLPGDGVIALTQLIAELRGRGYTGPWSLETFNPRLWADDPERVARRGKAALDAVLSGVS